ncbi:precorrin-3B C(17)-methyltransferase [Desulfosarcina sp. BuS5]|uniref:precorrin-3B C(17)-methyltransferase n=1 Tax=Desulfosarcina sp. BuS5 TaxID=933262 RepID=UPI000A04BC01|nr:precorrin-3B C(17)-methyltransferase [Desulfosarcina sp. BuS5]
MRSSSDSIGREREIDSSQTDKRKCNNCHSANALYIVGIGPGNSDYLSVRAHEVLEIVDTVAGYSTYIDLVRPLIKGKKIISTAMTKEVERVEAAINTALNGQSCAIVSSGDSGIYAMAGLALEMCQKKQIRIRKTSFESVSEPDGNELYIEVIPGIPALCSGAALLGAPLTHDFAAISLSDLLTPWDIIENRLEAAAKADFVVVLYNPKSKKRDWQIKKAREILLKYRDKSTPVGVATSAMRKDQRIGITTLEHLDTVPINMLTTVFIGNSTSTVYMDFMITPRGYSKKYKIKAEG